MKNNQLLILILLMHTIDNPELLTPRIIYAYDTKSNQVWNMTEYRTPREYLDPVLQVKERQWAVQKKGEKDRKYVTKKGFYMDYQTKVASGIPGSNKYGNNAPWQFPKEKALSKHRIVDPKLSKRTFLDEIQTEQRLRKKPGICTYSLQKSMKEKEADVEKMKKRMYLTGEKHFFHEDHTYLANVSPGVGSYSPHYATIRVRKNQSDYKSWVEKHKKQAEVMAKRSLGVPAPGTYSPMNTTFTTFDLLEKKDRSKEKSFGFGTDAKFQYTRPSKRKNVEKSPDPATYKKEYEWKGKKMSPKHRPLCQAISKGYQTLSIYH